ncbi:ribosome biogenesis GTPase Der [Candidatus Saccharibacteria bacterium]|nr:ribosome biogenesis GTPase Der [Candidatus Saccharibacteria bacterium]
MSKQKIVALIGQTNAGKSSLLNRMAHKNIAIVAREEGTTRDNVSAKIDDAFLLIDTAGLKNPEDDFEASIQDQINDAIEVADLILLTVDSSKYPDQKDKNIARAALKSKKPVFLVLNKSDLGESLDESEFLRLGIKNYDTFRTSATTGQGIEALKSAIKNNLGVRTGQNPDDDKERPIKLALIGRPNVGKSSLFNKLAKKQQAVVSSRQGTTRDINRIEIKYKGQKIEILDTAGLRKPGKREVGIEKFSAIRTLAAIEEADICALLVDSKEPHSKLDQSLAGQIVEAGKGIIVILTKADLLDNSKPVTSTISDKARKENTEQPTYTEIDNILDNLERDLDFLPFAPVLITSSETGKNVTRVFDLALEIDAARHTEIKTSDLNKVLREAVEAHPPAGLKNTHPKPKYIVQTDITPPWFVIHGREMELLHWSYKRYLERKIREVYPFVGTPIKFSYHNDRVQGKRKDHSKKSR